MEYETYTKQQFSVNLSERDLTTAILEYLSRRLSADVLLQHTEMFASYARDDATPTFIISGNDGLSPLLLTAEFENVIENIG